MIGNINLYLPNALTRKLVLFAMNLPFHSKHHITIKTKETFVKLKMKSTNHTWDWEDPI